MLKKITLLIIMFLLLIGICSTVNAEGNFALDSESIEVKLNGTKTILYTGGTGDITWTSLDTTIATVENGTVTGKKVGETTITATRGTESDTCTVKVVYDSIQIQSNENSYSSKVSLILDVHDTETLRAKVKDYKSQEVNDAVINWKSSDSSIVSIDSTGKMKALKTGTVTITAEAAGVSSTCEVTVYAEPDFTDFKNAKFETGLNDGFMEYLKITGIEPNDSTKNEYYYNITPNTNKPDINTFKDKLDINSEKKFLSIRNISKYAELKQDMYLWILQRIELNDTYMDEDGVMTRTANKFVVEGKKLDRAPLPPLNSILRGFSIDDFDSNKNTSFYFKFPSVTDNRKFNLKIGKVTDNAILTKIKNNDYTGITELLAYAKKNKAIFTKQLTTTSNLSYFSQETLFDGRKLLENKAYYFVYVQFDDENGKYYPIEGVTLGQANLSSTKNNWLIYSYTDDNFKWENLSSTTTTTTATPTPTPTSTTNKTEPKGTSPKTLPYTGKNVIIVASLFIVISAVGLVFYKKYNKYREIK